MHYDNMAHTRAKQTSVRGNGGDNRGRAIHSIRNIKRRVNTYVAPLVEEPVEEAPETETEIEETSAPKLRDLGFINGRMQIFVHADSAIIGNAMVAAFQEAHAQVLTGGVAQ